jgi:hypothetical protein
MPPRSHFVAATLASQVKALQTAGGGNVPGYDGLFVDESTGTLYKRNDAGVLTPVTVNAALDPASVKLASLSMAARGMSYLGSEVVAQTYPLDSTQTVTLTTTNRRMRVAYCVIPAGATVGRVRIPTGSTGAVGITHIVATVYTVSGNLMGRSADPGAFTWLLNEWKTFTLQTPIAPSDVDREVYVGLIMEATTMPTVAGSSGVSLAAPISPYLGGVPTTDPGSWQATMPDPLPASTSGTARFYAQLLTP